MIWFSQAIISLERLDRFMTSKELADGCVERVEGCEGGSVGQKGELAVVVGTVGSGYFCMTTSPFFFHLRFMLDFRNNFCFREIIRVCGSTAYVARTSWIQNGTIQDNILFGFADEQGEVQRVKILSSYNLLWWNLRRRFLPAKLGELQITKRDAELTRYKEQIKKTRSDSAQEAVKARAMRVLKQKGIISVGFYILLRAVDRFTANYNSFPGQFDGEMDEDISRLKTKDVALLNDLGCNGSNLTCAIYASRLLVLRFYSGR
ncbi:nedd8-activating enzyme e1 regulatory subunit [Phtheirospermum japonicum]|uniref:Nedd8-activating enzyme e1 regulatory subunit n=1 Tax=Phtheirospermum japonicum TaxID=374723 RepID=A0A830BLP4_9LAMI|nr:nedd8-activating enzyme e1 regulatory subunit [Phtheirospermum japonicum]